jgi:hypothetical protein
VIWPSFTDHNPQRDFVLTVTVAGLLAVLVTELALALLPSSTKATGPVNVSRAGVIAWIGAAVLLVSTQLGVGDYGYGVSPGLKQASHLSVFVSPLGAWPIIGVALALYSWRSQPEDRRKVLLICGVTLAAEIASALIQAGTANLMEFLLVLGVMSLLAGVIRPVWLVAGLLLVFLAWPTLYQFRNQSRSIVTGRSSTLTNGNPQSRLQLDRELADVKALHGVDIAGLPSDTTILSEAFIPRFLDPSRPILQTGTLLNEAIFGISTSSSTLTNFGGIWLTTGGYRGLIMELVIVSGAAGLLLRRGSPFSFVVVALAVHQLLWIEAVFPDALAGMGQYTVSAAVAMLVFRPTAPAHE